MEFKGIDVSTFQRDINWPEIANSDIDFAIIRSSYGVTGVDAMFAQNMAGISSTNINAGAYHYCYAQNAENAIKEALHFIDTVKQYKFPYPLALDLEETSIGLLGKPAVAEIINAFLNTLRQQKYYPILYTNLSWLQRFIDPSLIPDTEIWLAEWGPNLTYKDNVTIWQHSNTGRIPGINTAVDLNISYKDYPAIIKKLGLNNMENTNPNPEPEPEPSVRQYVVKRGDSLWSIAQKLMGNGTKYREIMSLNGLTSDVIYPGQILNIPINSSSPDILYVVKRGDTLWGIAKRFLNSGEDYRKIMEANGLTSDVIYPGETLKIPL